MKFKKKGWVFAQVPIWATCDPNVSDGALRLFVYLAWRQGKDGCCWPSRARMARDLNASQETIRRRLRELEEAAYLITAHRPGHSNQYTLVADPNGASDRFTPASERKTTPPRSEGGPHPNLRGHPPQSCVGTPLKTVPHDDKKGREEEDGEKQDEAILSLWTRTLEELQLQMTRPVFETWLRRSTARLEGEVLVVELANQRAVDWVSHRLHGVVCRTVRRVFEEEGLSVAYEVA